MSVSSDITYVSKIKDYMFDLPMKIECDRRIGIIDSDLLDNGTRHPNLALMKISAFFKSNGNDVNLVKDYNEIDIYDVLILSKVFTYTKLNNFIFNKEIYIGGTGFSLSNYPDVDLPVQIEHCCPDYSLYDEYIAHKIKLGEKESKWRDYKEFSIGFITRGCFRKCEFCVNKKYDSAFKHADIAEFLDESRKRIYLWDDNFFAYPKWEEELDKLIETGKYFQFKQGLDIRLMTDYKAEKLSKCKYYGDFIFAFDNIEDADLIEKKLAIWRKYNKKNTKLYLFCAYDSQDANDIEKLFQRIEILFKYKCLPYVMRYQDYQNSEFREVYVNVTRWANQQNIVKKMSFREFCEREQELKVDQSKKCASLRSLNWFEEKYPEIASKYFNMKYSDY
jgi:hypothetical protein